MDGSRFAGDGEPERANAARSYDYWLGGAQNFAVDRDHAERIARANPDAVPTARANRAFLARAVQWVLDRGVDQFLDLGSGVPTVGNVHEIAHRQCPGSRVAYVDVEPVAVARAGHLLGETRGATITRADLRDPPGVLGAPTVAGLLDFDRPVALLAVAVLHYVPEPLGDVLAPYRRRLAPGSVVVLSHASHDQDDPDLRDRLLAGAEAFRGSASEVTLRTRDELRAAVPDLVLQPSDLVDITDWPDTMSTVPPVGFYAVVGTVDG